RRPSARARSCRSCSTEGPGARAGARSSAVCVASRSTRSAQPSRPIGPCSTTWWAAEPRGETLDAPAHRLRGRRVGGRYELLALVGRGAMADVFRAVDVETNTRVAVKLVPSELVTSPVAAARFQREVKASSKLDHPAIVRVHAWGIDADHGYIVM